MRQQVRSLTLGVGLVLLSLSSFGQDKVLVEADSLFNLGQYEETISLLNTHIISGDASSEAYSLRGYSQYFQGYPDLALVDFNEGLSKSDSCSSCYLGQAMVLAFSSKYDMALDAIESAIKIDPESSNAYVVRGQVRVAKGSQAMAMMDFNKAVKLDPENPRVYIERGRYHINRGAIHMAQPDIKQALTLDSNVVAAHYLQTQFCTTVGDWEGALKSVDKCINLEPNTADYYGTKATILFYTSDFQGSVDANTLAIELGDEHPQTYENRALSRYKLEDMDGACEDFQRALELTDPMMSERVDGLESQIASYCDYSQESYYYHRGIADYNLGDFEAAIEHYNSGLAIFPESSFTHSFRGNAYKRIGEYEKASVDYLLALKFRENHLEEVKGNANMSGMMNPEEIVRVARAEIMSNVAECNTHLGNYDIAMNYADSSISALKGKPEYSDVLSVNLHVRGILHDRLGDRMAALADFNESLQLTSDNAIVHFNKAIVLAYEGQAEHVSSSMFWVTLNSPTDRAIEFTLPSGRKYQPKTEDLRAALTSISTAIELEGNVPEMYLLRAFLKIQLGDTDYCLDVLRGEELGITDVAKGLGVKCK